MKAFDIYFNRNVYFLSYQMRYQILEDLLEKSAARGFNSHDCVGAKSSDDTSGV